MAKYSKGEWNSFGKNGLSIYQLYLYCLLFKNVSKSLWKIRCKMWFDGENESYDVELIQNNILVKGLLISVQNYKVISFSSLTF